MLEGLEYPHMDQGTHNKIVSFIWGIADDVLLFKRGKYPDVILPMCVLRRLDAVLEPTKKAILETKDMLDKAGITEQRAGFHREHDWQYRVARVCDDTPTRTVRRTLGNCAVGFSCRSSTRREDDVAGDCRFTGSIRGTSIPAGGGLSVCCLDLQYRISKRFAGRFFSTIRSDCLDGARDGHTECTCPKTRNPGSHDNGPDANDHRDRRRFFARKW
jgi:hypothetical protein